MGVMAKKAFDSARTLPANSRLDRIFRVYYLIGRKRDPGAALAEVNALIREHADYLPARFMKVEVLKAARNFESALETCGILLMMRKDDPAVINLRAVLYQMKGDLNAARSDFQTLLARDPHDDGVRYQLLALLARQGKATEKEHDSVLAEGLQINPQSATLLNWRGWRHQLAGEYDRAIADYRAALASDPHHVYAQINLGNAYIRSNRAEEGLNTWKRMLQAPDQPRRNRSEIYRSIGWYWWSRDDNTRALSNFRRGLDIFYNPAIHNNIVVILVNTLRNGEAILELEKLLELSPNNLPALARRGICRLLTYDLAGARQDLDRSIKKWRGDPNSWVLKGRALLAKLVDEVDRATSCFQATRDALEAEIRKVPRKSGQTVEVRFYLDFFSDFAFFVQERTPQAIKLEQVLREAREIRKAWQAKPDPALDAAEVAWIGRKRGWRQAVAAYQETSLPDLKPDDQGSRMEWIRTLAAGSSGEQETSHRTRCRQLLEGKAPDLKPAGPNTSPRAAWVLGRAHLDEGNAGQAVKLLSAAARELGVGACHLDHACALAVAGHVEDAAAALTRALGKGVTAYFAVKRLHHYRIEASPAIRKPLLDLNRPGTP